MPRKSGQQSKNAKKSQRSKKKSQEAKNQEAKNQEVKNQEAKIQEAKNQEEKSQEAKSQEAKSQEAKNQEAKNQETTVTNKADPVEAGTSSQPKMAETEKPEKPIGIVTGTPVQDASKQKSPGSDKETTQTAEASSSNLFSGSDDDDYDPDDKSYESPDYGEYNPDGDYY